MKLEDRRQRKKAKTKENIFNAALELFLKKGYDETTIDEITERADVAKGTFFNHFPTKDAVLFYIGEKRNILLAHALKDELNDIKSAKKKLFEYFKIIARFNEEEKEITRLIIREYFTRAFTSSQIVEQVVQSNVNFEEMLGIIIDEGKKLGEFRSDCNTSHSAEILAGIYFFTLFPWLEGKLSDSLTKELLARVELFMTGIEA